MMMNTKTVLSDETKISFVNWLNNWDEKILTHDDRHTQEITSDKFNWCIGIIYKILSDTDDAVMKKFSDDEGKVNAMIKNQEKPFYKNLRKIADFLNTETILIEHLYELKNRKSHENIKLKAEIARLKSELHGRI